MAAFQLCAISPGRRARTVLAWARLNASQTQSRYRARQISERVGEPRRETEVEDEPAVAAVCCVCISVKTWGKRLQR